MSIPTTYAKARAQVERLVEHFARNLDLHRRPEYRETQVRIEFIDPFFEALGWDVRNVRGARKRDVVHEDIVRASGTTRAPDYSFRIDGKRRFFLEAKRPSVLLAEDVGPAYQLRRYGWSAKLPLSILTDFEEFAVYDCRYRPKPSDKTHVARVTYLTFEEYLDRFDDVYGVFAREAVEEGSFDRYVQESQQKRGVSEVDAEFLKEIEGWRDVLARNIALRNAALSVHELNFAVQRTIDRVIFLRMCEDRGVEVYGRLLALADGPHVYARLRDLYRQADEKYNAGLFDFRADTLTPDLAVDDKVLAPILAGLYYPRSPYEFSVLPAHVLGQVYEQFLGKVIRLTPSHRAKVEEKPEVRKAGGVYYTPAYIVDYIVARTVGRLVAGKSPDQVSGLRVLDPACGSGSFLLGAYQHLLDYHLQWYEADGPEKHAGGRRPALYRGPGGDWRLTTAEKKRILLNNIYGVDIDRQAVEVTKLSLLLQVLEGESDETLGEQLTLWREPALPDLADNVKCGNSLIGPDYFAGQLMPDEEEMRRVNAFDWQAEFPAAMAAGGFDAVIGNPPYVIIGKDIFSASQQDYFCRYDVAQYKTDLFQLFLQRGLELSKDGGILGYIVPNPWLTQKFTDKLRHYILRESRVREIVVFNHLVFESANVYTALVFLEKGNAEPNHLIFIKNIKEASRAEDISKAKVVQVPQLEWQQADGFRFETRLIGEVGKFVSGVINTWPSLADVARASLGCQAYNSSKHTKEQIKNRVFHASHKVGDEYLPELAGSDVGRYTVERNRGQWIKYGPWLHDYRTMDWLEGPRILIREIPGRPPYRIQACYVEETYCNYKTILNVNPDDTTSFSMKYLCGILNSRLLSFLYPYMSNKLLAQSFPRISVGDLRKLPIRTIDFSDPADAARHDALVALVERMLALQRQLAAAAIPDDKRLYQRQIEATDRQIDRLVYELYGLTEEEVRLVEGT
ncbi:MAG: N-6 DNA methylase [Anaerolineae bacterium]|nr:N-6 DNA methylase [Anaerolineae bacterium]